MCAEQNVVGKKIAWTIFPRRQWHSAIVPAWTQIFMMPASRRSCRWDKIYRSHGHSINLYIQRAGRIYIGGTQILRIPSGSRRWNETSAREMVDKQPILVWLAPSIHIKYKSVNFIPKYVGLNAPIHAATHPYIYTDFGVKLTDLF